MDPNTKQATAAALRSTQAFRQLDPATQRALLRDIGTALADPYSLALDTPADLTARLRQGGATGQNGSPQQATGSSNATPVPNPKKSATETLAARAGALSDEIDFPQFVAGLVHGTFDAIVDASIRQMETFADLVSAVAKGADQFTSENVTTNQARDYLVGKYPGDLALDLTGSPRLVPRRANGTQQPDEAPTESPGWLAEFGLDGQTLDEELIEGELVPAAQRRLGESRVQMLATMVLLGMNRVVVRDGSISAKLKFRAAATDKTNVDYASSQDSGGAPGGNWGERGARTYQAHSTVVSTVGVNAQQEQVLDASLYGEVRINFATETLPLERFADSARLALLQRNARAVATQPIVGGVPASPAPASQPVAAPGVNGAVKP